MNKSDSSSDLQIRGGSMSDSIVLCVGEDYRVPGLLQGYITYAGMPSECAYSFVHKREIGATYAYNLFYPINKQQITLARVKILVEDVTSDEIRFRIEQ
jgi:hypothetical protein